MKFGEIGEVRLRIACRRAKLSRGRPVGASIYAGNAVRAQGDLRQPKHASRWPAASSPTAAPPADQPSAARRKNSLNLRSSRFRLADDTPADSSLEVRAWKDSKVAKPNQGRSFEAARTKVGIVGHDGLIQLRHDLLELGTDSADEEILEGRHPLQEEDRPVLECAVP